MICVSHLSGMLKNWQHQSVVVYGSTGGFDSYGNPTSSSASTHTVLIQQVNRPVRTAQGIDKVSTVQILFGSTADISINDKITLPDGQQPLILSIEKTVDFNGNLEYVKVFT